MDDGGIIKGGKIEREIVRLRREKLRGKDNEKRGEKMEFSEH